MRETRPPASSPSPVCWRTGSFVNLSRHSPVKNYIFDLKLKGLRRRKDFSENYALPTFSPVFFATIHGKERQEISYP